jgi:hypothetical protein
VAADGRIGVEVITNANTSVSATLTIAEYALEHERHAFERRAAQRSKSDKVSPRVAARPRLTTKPVISVASAFRASNAYSRTASPTTALARHVVRKLRGQLTYRRVLNILSRHNLK